MVARGSRIVKVDISLRPWRLYQLFPAAPPPAVVCNPNSLHFCENAGIDTLVPFLAFSATAFVLDCGRHLQGTKQIPLRLDGETPLCDMREEGLSIGPHPQIVTRCFRRCTTWD